jgi:phthiocerol/phenolphthiocerol synthesis type-I polyketide synthase E
VSQMQQIVIGAHTDADLEPRSPQTSDPIHGHVSNQLAHIWQHVLGVDSIGLDQNFFDLGGDSSLAVQMFAEIERAFGVKLPLATLYEASTISELAAILFSQASKSRWSPLVAIQPNGSRPAFFCMHGAGGNVLNYRDLSRHLGGDQPFYGLQSQGLDGNCALLTKVEEMAELYLREIRRVQPHGPYFLGGYCMGGTVAYEVAQQLISQGERVAVLALFDTMNWYKIPRNVWTRGAHTFQQWMFHFAAFLSLDLSGKARFLREKMAVLRSRIPVWRGAVLSWFGKSSSVATSDDLLLANIWKVNDRASWTYIPTPYAGKVMDFRPMKQYWVFNKPDLKWDGLVEGRVEITALPVYPGSMLVEPFVSHLAAALRKELDTALNQKGAC